MASRRMDNIGMIALENIVDKLNKPEKQPEQKPENKEPIMKSLREYLSGKDTVSRDFMIEEEDAPVRFENGGADRVMLMFNRDTKPDEEALQNFVNMMAAVNNGSFTEAYLLMDQLTWKLPAVFYRENLDEMMDALHKAGEEIMQDRLLSYLEEYMEQESEPENMKMMILLCGFLDEIPETIEEKVRILIRVPELTSYFERCIAKMPDVNDMLFECAKKSEGYAKVGLIQMLEPTTDEICDWMMTEGYDPFLAWHYTAGYIAKKCDVYHMLLKEDLTDEEFDRIGNVIGHYYSEGWAENLEEYEYYEESMFEYLKAGRKRLTEGYISSVMDIRHDMESFLRWKGKEAEEYYRSIYDLCDEILNDPAVPEKIRKLNEEGSAFWADQYYGICGGETYLSYLEKDYYRYAYDYSCLGENRNYRIRYAEIMSEKVDYTKLGQDEEYDNIIIRSISLCLNVLENEPELQAGYYQTAYKLGILEEYRYAFIEDACRQVQKYGKLIPEFEELKGYFENSGEIEKYMHESLRKMDHTEKDIS